jgi:hypothetical protein
MPTNIISCVVPPEFETRSLFLRGKKYMERYLRKRVVKKVWAQDEIKLWAIQGV